MSGMGIDLFVSKKGADPDDIKDAAEAVVGEESVGVNEESVEFEFESIDAAGEVLWVLIENGFDVMATEAK